MEQYKQQLFELISSQEYIDRYDGNKLFVPIKTEVTYNCNENGKLHFGLERKPAITIKCGY